MIFLLLFLPFFSWKLQELLELQSTINIIQSNCIYSIQDRKQIVLHYELVRKRNYLT